MEELAEDEEIAEEVVEHAHLAILGEDEVRLAMYIVLLLMTMLPPHKTCQKVKIKEKQCIIQIGDMMEFLAVCDGQRNHYLCVHFAPDIKPTELQMFHMVFFWHFIERVLLHKINERM